MDGHVRRLEVLRRAGIAQRLAAGLWAVPSDLVERGKAYDFKRLGGIELELHSRSPLDRQLVAGGGSVPTQGFGGVTREALTARIDFLAEQGLVQREDRRVVGKTNLLSTLRNREINSVAQRIQQQTRLTYRPAAEGARVSGTYRQSVMLASGRFAMLDDGLGFSLVPWKPVIEPSLGRTISAVISNGEASWYLGRQRGFSR